MEDTQPNEVRLARKGYANIPRVRATHPVHSSHESRQSKRPTRQTPRQSTATSNTHGHQHVKLYLPRECHKGVTGSHSARKRWIEDQKYHLWANRHLSVLSFQYLDHDNSVQFKCRIRRAIQPTGHPARDDIRTGSHQVDAQLGTESTRFTQQVTGFLTDVAQNSEPGPSRIRPISHTFTGVSDCPLRLEDQAPYPVERKLVKPSATEICSHSNQTSHATPGPPQRAGVYTTLPAEVIDLTLEPPGPISKESPARWSVFRSGYVEILLPPLSNSSTVSSPEVSVNQQQDIGRTPEPVVGYHEDMPVFWSSDVNPHSARPSIRTSNTGDHRACGSLLKQSRQDDTLEAAHSPVRENEAEVPPVSDPNTPIRGFSSACENLVLSLGPHDRPRRILHGLDFTYVVTAHGTIDQVDTNVLKLDRIVQSSSSPFEESVDDACILSHQEDPLIILGHGRRENQITLLSLDHGHVSRRVAPRRDWHATKRPGVSAVTSLMSPLKFATGGYDHRVHLWGIASDLSGVSGIELAIRHTSLIHSLLPIMDTSHKLVSVGADRDIPIYDMSAERVVQTLKTSCIPYHAHRTDSRSCTLLEVSHLETQFEVRDLRSVNRTVQTFGFLAEERRGRFEKAESWSHFVACGDKNGAVHFWDLRNVSTEIALQHCFNDPVIQVVHIGPRLLACSKRNELACINFFGE